MINDFYSGFDSYSPISIDYPSLNIVREYTPSISCSRPYPSLYTSSSSASEPYTSGSLEVSYFGSSNEETISGSVIDSTSPYYIAESIPFGTGRFSFSAFASYWP